MVMRTLQIRLSDGMVEGLDDFVSSGLYSSRSDVVRAAVRRMIIEHFVGVVPDNGIDSVKEIRKVRNKLSKQNLSLEEINRIE